MNHNVKLDLFKKQLQLKKYFQSKPGISNMKKKSNLQQILI